MHVFFYILFFNNQTHRITKAQSTRPQTGTSNTCTLTLFPAKYVFFFIFAAMAIAVFFCAVSKINVFVYL